MILSRTIIVFAGVFFRCNFVTGVAISTYDFAERDNTTDDEDVDDDDDDEDDDKDEEDEVSRLIIIISISFCASNLSATEGGLGHRHNVAPARPRLPSKIFQLMSMGKTRGFMRNCL